MDDVPARLGTYLPDRVAGGLMLSVRLGFLAHYLIGFAQAWLQAKDRVGENLFEWVGFRGSVSLADSLLSFALGAWLAIGVFEERRWAFTGGLLLTGSKLFLETMETHGPSPTNGRSSAFWIGCGLDLCVFVYCGLRLIGTFGPPRREVSDERGFAFDRAAGATMLVGFAAILGFGVWNWIDFRARVGDGGVGFTDWLTSPVALVGDLWNFALQAWLCAGVCRSRKVFFGLTSLYAGERLCRLLYRVDTLRRVPAPSAMTAFFAVAFVCCGLRAVGAFGPKATPERTS